METGASDGGKSHGEEEEEEKEVEERAELAETDWRYI